MQMDFAIRKVSRSDPFDLKQRLLAFTVVNLEKQE